jgi:hypothetical protein
MAHSLMKLSLVYYSQLIFALSLAFFFSLNDLTLEFKLLKLILSDHVQNQSSCQFALHWNIVLECYWISER